MTGIRINDSFYLLVWAHISPKGDFGTMLVQAPSGLLHIDCEVVDASQFHELIEQFGRQ